MPVETHINVTVDFSKWGKGRYDVRIPAHQPIKQLLSNLNESLRLELPNYSLFAVKIPTKELLLADDDQISEFLVANGDILLVL
ncbi:EsaB/YukD family protein [Aeribacillus pallidus]|uniref:Uncharacterized protein n=1 Tax=Aeribacillus pallidus TaxID=33936 RepID=A0A223E1Z2_9BACI|nr:EsaB/YukD family protein [Aeribacillus pallidus]ASS89165.1 hypothetical protein AP3564_01775 [Aeribacillus pallidus]